MDPSRLPDKPRPEPTALSAPYWDGLRAHRLLLQRCSRCGQVRHYPRPVCDACYAMEYDWVEASRVGRVHSWTVCHHAFDPAFKAELPYVLVTVDLDEGVRVQAPLRGAGDDALRLDRAVAIDFEDVDETLTLPCVRLAD
ncbi:MAG: OB-fold domain-containing protein [Gammaproteobacteria bacterium]